MVNLSKTCGILPFNYYKHHIVATKIPMTTKFGRILIYYMVIPRIKSHKP